MGEDDVAAGRGSACMFARQRGMALEPVLTVAQVAEHIGCSKRHVYRLIRTGQLRSFKFGNRMYRIPVSAVEECGLGGNPHRPAALGPAPSPQSSADSAERLVRFATRLRSIDTRTL